jgi:hypothetical protein
MGAGSACKLLTKATKQKEKNDKENDNDNLGSLLHISNGSKSTICKRFW